MKRRASRVRLASVMELAEALVFLDGCRFWSITGRAAHCSVATPKPQSVEAAYSWQPFVRTAVRRKRGESLGAMIVRLSEAAAARKASGYGCHAAASCAACGGRQSPIRLEPRVRLPLCRDCRRGLEAPVPAGR